MATQVQSVDRVFALLECLADGGGSLSPSELAAQTRLPMPTIHRLARSLVVPGYVRQEASKRYALGPRMIRLGESASRMLGEVGALLVPTGMPARTPNTLTTPEAMQDALEAVRRQGYAVDDGEQELGVRCVAVPVLGLPFPAAISVSGPDSRVTLDAVTQIAPDLQAVGDQLRTAFCV